MKLYIWNGGISSGYHDDGTLVVLADSADQARELAIASAPADFEAELDIEEPESLHHWLDGHEEWCQEAILRDPDVVLDIDLPRVVVFNGGGYD